MHYESAEKENSRSLVPLQGAGRQAPRVLPSQGDICLDIFFYRTGLSEYEISHYLAIIQFPINGLIGRGKDRYLPGTPGTLVRIL